MGVYPILPIDSLISPRYESGNNSNSLKLLNKEGRGYFLEGLGDGNDALLPLCFGFYGISADGSGPISLEVNVLGNVMIPKSE